MSNEFLSLKLDATHAVQAKTLQLFGSVEFGPDVDWEIVLVQTIECTSGQELGQLNNTIGCVACTGNTVSADGKECIPCAAGLVPNQENAECIMCPEAFHFSDMGQCELCEAPLVPNIERTSCMCPVGTYNSSLALACFLTDYIAPPVADVPGSAGLYACQSCIGLECIDECDGDTFTISTGWVRYTQTSVVTPIFKCRYPGACPGGVFPSTNQTCADNYNSTLCGVCAEGFQLKKDGHCEPCGETSFLGGVIIFVVVLTVLALLAMTVKVLYNYVVMLQEIAELTKQMQLKAVGKMLLALVQITGAHVTVSNSLVTTITSPLNFATVQQSRESEFCFASHGSCVLL